MLIVEIELKTLFWYSLLRAVVVAHRTTDLEVTSSIPSGSWALFSTLFSLNQYCILTSSLVELQHNCFSAFQDKMEAKQV